MILNLYQVDSFTGKIFTGNPAGVVSNAGGLTDSQMQKIAREMNNSETAFILPPDTDDHDVHVRFFTPLREVPICGHATIAAHYVMAVERNYSKTVRIFQKTGAGILPVDIEVSGDSYKVTMTQGKPEFGDILEGNVLDTLTAALNVSPENLIENAPVQIVSTGHSKVLIGLKKYEILDGLKPDFQKLSELSEVIGCNGYYAFTFDSREKEVLAVGRMFAPAIGINEDPVTGNANGPLGAYLVRYGLAHDSDCFKFRAKQGISIGREGIIEVEVDAAGNLPLSVRVSGEAIIVFKTEIVL